MSDRFIDWLFDTLISVDVQHQELLRGFGVLLLIPFALFLLSYVRVSFAFIKDRARKSALGTVTRVLAAELGLTNIRGNFGRAGRRHTSAGLDLTLRRFAMTSQRSVVFAEPVRTAIGTFGGSLKDVPAPTLGSVAIAAAVTRADIRPDDVETVVMGNVIQAGTKMN